MGNQPQSSSMLRVHHLLAYEKRLLLIFYTHKGYQFRVVTSQGKILGQQQLFYRLEAALQEGRHCLVNSSDNC